jgi:hypothetical protein
MNGELDLTAIVESLRRNALTITAQVASVGDEQARWRPEPAKWSILEVVAHLADEEVEDFRARVRSTLDHRDADWAPIDPEGWAVQRRYNEGSLADVLARFASERAKSIAWLEGLECPDWSRAHEHPEWGPFSAGDLLTAWVAHDHIHVRQLNRLQREYLVSVVSDFSPSYAGSW